MRTLTAPEQPLARLWYAGNLLREHRGDGHVVALVANGIGGTVNRDVLSDPMGSVPGIGDETEATMSNDVNYFEIGSPDAQAARAFYGGLFGWTFGEPSMPARYSMIDNDKGGLWDTSAMGGTSWAIFYVQVDNVQAALDRAQELGATVAVPLVDNGQIEFAHLVDPHGSRFGIWKPKNA